MCWTWFEIESTQDQGKDCIEMMMVDEGKLTTMITHHPHCQKIYAHKYGNQQ